MEFAKENKLQDFKVKQIFYELFKNQNIDLGDMTTLSKDLRKDLGEKFEVINLKIDKIFEDPVKDGVGAKTTKFSFKTEDRFVIEAVLMYHWSKREE